MSNIVNVQVICRFNYERNEENRAIQVNTTNKMQNGNKSLNRIVLINLFVNYTCPNFSIIISVESNKASIIESPIFFRQRIVQKSAIDLLTPADLSSVDVNLSGLTIKANR